MSARLVCNYTHFISDIGIIYIFSTSLSGILPGGESPGFLLSLLWLHGIEEEVLYHRATKVGLDSPLGLY
jgi:hypothetical protein